MERRLLKFLHSDSDSTVRSGSFALAFGTIDSFLTHIFSPLRQTVFHPRYCYLPFCPVQWDPKALIRLPFWGILQLRIRTPRSLFLGRDPGVASGPMDCTDKDPRHSEVLDRVNLALLWQPHRIDVFRRHVKHKAHCQVSFNLKISTRPFLSILLEIIFSHPVRLSSSYQALSKDLISFEIDRFSLCQWVKAN